MDTRQPVIPIRTADDLDAHRRRELATIDAMFRVYCADHHCSEPDACELCSPLLEYATRRLVRCVFGASKPTCANCTVHCYTETMRVKIKNVMRYAGPRMLWRHPYLAITHVLDGKRAAPVLAKASRKGLGPTRSTISPASEPASRP